MRITLELLSNYDENQFSEFILKCLTEQYSSDEEVRYRACDFRNLGIDRQESYLEDMRCLFEKFSDTAKLKFRRAVYNLLTVKKPEYTEVTMRDLLCIAVFSEVNDVIPNLAKMIRDEALIKRYPTLLYEVASWMMCLEGIVYEESRRDILSFCEGKLRLSV